MRERVAREWHDGSDHARDGEPFGGPMCNCHAVAGRIIPMLSEAWDEGHDAGMDRADHPWRPPTPNPYETGDEQ